MTSSAFTDVDPYLAGKPMTYFLHSSMTKEKLVKFLRRNGASQACVDHAIKNLGSMLLKLLQEQDDKIPTPTTTASEELHKTDATPVHADHQGGMNKEIDDDVFRIETSQDYEEGVETSGVPSESLQTSFANGSPKNEGLVNLNYQESSM